MKLSEKELAMFKALGMDWVEETAYRVANRLYRDAAMECFIENKTGPAVESLRRCLIALVSGDVERETEEWDNLIQL